jgi:tetratricopeptide (TPR) repeat protein
MMSRTLDARFPRDWGMATAVGVALALATFVAYSRCFNYPFVNYDDPTYVFQNAHVQAGLSADSVNWAFTTFDCGYWHPLTWLSLQLDYELYGGLNSGGFHLTNVLMHTANTLLLFLVLRGMTGMLWRSAMVAALFALHPLHVESVAWVTERKDVLFTLFWMLTLAGYLSYVRVPSVRRYLLAALPLALGLMAKPMLVTLPCVLLLLDYWPLRRWRRDHGQPQPAPPTGSSLPPAVSLRYLVLEKLPLFALVLPICIVIFLAQLQGQAVAPLEAFPLAARIGNALLAYVGYLAKMLWPMHLAVYYPHPGADGSVVQAVGAGFLLAVITALVLGPGRRWPYLAVGWLWYVGTLVPVIGLVQVGSQGMADRFTYVPLIGVFLLLTWGAADLAEAWNLPRQYLAGASAVVLSACFILTWIQVGYWQSTLELWKHAVAVTDKNLLAHINLGTSYHERNMLSDARKEFEQAAAIDPNLAEAHVNLGNVLADLEQWDRAVAEYQKAIRLDSKRAGAHFNLGNLLAKLGRSDEALTELQTAIDLEPENPAPHINLGNVLRDMGRLEEALAEYQRAMILDPKDVQCHNNQGIALAELGRRTEAIAAFRKAIGLDPQNATTHVNLGRAFQDEGRLEEALAEYQLAAQRGDLQAQALLQTCERLRALRPRLPELSAGRDRPADNTERLAFAELCRQPGERRYALAARLYADAFGADSKGADYYLLIANRFSAACVAAAAGCDQGQDAAGLDDKEKTTLRKQALDWLHADLTLMTKLSKDHRPQAGIVRQRVIRTWQREAMLAGVREPAALAMLSDSERQAWQKLWQDVDATLDRASAPRKSR